MKMLQSMSAVVVVLACSVHCYAALHDEESFLLGNKLYKQGQYEQAEKAYQALERKGYPVWFNLGNCAYQRGDYARAYASWLRAQRGAPATAQAMFEKYYAFLATQPGVVPMPDSSLQMLVKRLSPLWLQFITLLVWVVVCWMLVRGWWRYKKFIFSGVGVLLCVCGILAAASYFLWQHQYVVTRHTTIVYAGPDERYHVVGTLEGIRAVDVCGRRDAWYKVRYNTTVGWIPERDGIIV